jgi:hypothetical protein
MPGKHGNAKPTTSGQEAKNEKDWTPQSVSAYNPEN